MSIGKTYNILVTGVGAIIGYGVIESLRLSKKSVNIIGIDIYDDCYGKFISDKFEVAPYTNDVSYFPWLTALCARYEIDLIIPGIEQDLFAYNENRNKLSTPISINQFDIINLAKDKFDTFQFLSKLDTINVIPTYLNLDYETALQKLGLPFIIKPRKSYASKGFHIIKNQIDFLTLVGEINENTIFQPNIGNIDEEYTFSVFGRGDGTIVDQIILRRYLSKEGATQKAFVVEEDSDLQLYVDVLVKNLKPEGPTNFQFRKQDGNAYLLEINPRISSACSIRSKFGYNEPQYCIEHYLEEKKYSIQSKSAGSAIRHISDLIIK